MTYAKVEQQPARFVSLGGRRRTPLTDHDHPELCLFSLALRPPQRYQGAHLLCEGALLFSGGQHMRGIPGLRASAYPARPARPLDIGGWRVRWADESFSGGHNTQARGGRP